MWRQLSLILCLTLAMASATHAQGIPAQADTLEATPADTSVSPHSERIAELIQQLDSPRFAERQEASSELSGLGRETIPALEEVIQFGSREASTRALAVLEGFMQDCGMETQAAAAAALTRVAEGADSIAANDAREALNQSEQDIAGRPQGDFNVRALFPAQGIRVVPAQQLQPAIVPGMRIVPARVQVRPVRVQAQRMIMRQGNGTREIEVTENGRTVKITEDANGIELQVTEPDEQGNDQTETYEAENAEELKKQHPEAGKLYEQYGQMGPQLAPPGAAPVFPGIQPNNMQVPPQNEDLKAQAEQLQEVMEFFGRLEHNIELEATPAEDFVDPAAPQAEDSGADE